MRKERNARHFHNFLHKKARNPKNFSLFLQFFVILVIFCDFLHLSFYAIIFLAMWKKREMQYARNKKWKNARNNAIREILFIANNRMQELCKKIEKFENCDNYRTCLIGCNNCDIVVDLCSELLMRLSYHIHLAYSNSKSLSPRGNRTLDLTILSSPWPLNQNGNPFIPSQFVRKNSKL